MLRFTNSLSGSVVNVDEATAAQLGPDWVPAAGKAEPRKPEAKQPRRKSN